MSVSQHMLRVRRRLTRDKHKVHDRSRCRGRDPRGRMSDERVDQRVATASVQTPSGPKAAEEALAWLAQEFSWQSTLERLEGHAGS